MSKLACTRQYNSGGNGGGADVVPVDDDVAVV